MRRRSLLSAVFASPVLIAGPSHALYDPSPDAALSGAQGDWSGTLTYRDYRQPDRLVSLPTRLFVALGGPAELVLHFVFDDGPSKKVYSYDRLTFDFRARQLSWTSGAAERTSHEHVITAVVHEGPESTVTFERKVDGTTHRQTLRWSPQRLELTKDEVAASGESTFRNRYLFTRTGA